MRLPQSQSCARADSGLQPRPNASHVAATKPGTGAEGVSLAVNTKLLPRPDAGRDKRAQR